MDDLQGLLARGYRYALSLTHDRAKAEDLLHDGVLALLRKRAPRVPAYLIRTIRNRFIDLYRREHLVVMHPLDDVGDEAMLGLDEPEPDVDPERLAAALATLRPQEREALYLTAVEDYTAQEVADLTGRPRGTILSMIHRARAKLRSVLAEPRRKEQG